MEDLEIERECSIALENKIKRIYREEEDAHTVEEVKQHTPTQESQ